MIKDFDIVHIKEVAEIERLSFSDPWSENALLESLESPYSFFKVFVDGGVLGYIGFYAVAGEGAVTNVAVHPNSRGLGIGEKLIKAIIEEGKRQNVEYITLEVRTSNEKARRLYSRCGFIDVGVRKNFYSNPKEDAVIMNYFFNKEK